MKQLIAMTGYALSFALIAPTLDHWLLCVAALGFGFLAGWNYGDKQQTALRGEKEVEKAYRDGASDGKAFPHIVIDELWLTSDARKFVEGWK